jgi:hypothetical protein
VSIFIVSLLQIYAGYGLSEYSKIDMPSDEKFEEILNNNDNKDITLPKEKIVKVLKNHREHLKSLNEIYEESKPAFTELGFVQGFIAFIQILVIFYAFIKLRKNT